VAEAPAPAIAEDPEVIVRRNEGGAAWADLARLDPLAAVLDPGDRAGLKNRLIDRIHKSALSGVARTIRGRRVLDVGCGTGRLSAWLAESGADVVGVDATPEMIDVALRLVPGAHFELIDGATLPFDDDDFDVVVTAYVLQYYVRGGSPLVHEIARVLRPGGCVYTIEQATDDATALGRGGSIADYRHLFDDAGLDRFTAVPIRLGDSRVVDTVQYRPRLLRLPGLAPLAKLEARHSSAPLVGGRYADVLFTAAASRQPGPSS
jgi:SAM-dependent methyltransferase